MIYTYRSGDLSVRERRKVTKIPPQNLSSIFCDCRHSAPSISNSSKSSAVPSSVYFVTVFLLFANLDTVLSQDNFYFSVTPESADVIEGRDVVLRCGVSKTSHIKYYWTLDTDRLSNSTRRFQRGSTLFIHRVNHTEDSGIFHCIATNTSSGYALKSSEAVLNILWLLPKAEVQLRRPKPADVNVGSEMKLRCYVSGNPEPTYAWFKNDVPLLSNAHLAVRDNQLIVWKLRSADSGVYSCQASNEAGFISSDKNYLLNLEDDDPSAVKLDVSKFSKNVVVKESSTAYLDCVYSNVVRTEWYFKSARLSDSSRIQIYTNGTLRILSTKAYDEGAYVCRGVGSKTSQEFSSRLSISKLEDFSNDSFEPRQIADLPFVVAQGKSSRINCFIPKGIPDPDFYWEDSIGQRVPLSGRIYSEGTSMRITNANPRDSGQYACVAHNLSGEKKGIIQLVVSSPSLITKHPEPVRVMEGAPANMKCSFSGTPYPVSRIMWYRDDKPLPPSQRYKINYDQGTLYITKTEIIDRGVYNCIINTTAQQIRVSKPALMQIRRKLKFTAKPVSNKLLELESVSRIVCQAEGPEDEAAPMVYWLQTNGSTLPSNVVDKSGILEFSPVLPNDKANYTCRATSGSQGTITTHVQVDVVVRPLIKVKPKNTTAYEGFPVMLHCLATGDPPPRIKWDKDQVDVEKLGEPDRIQILKNGSLSLSQVYLEDRGKYGCMAGNSGGLTRVEIYLDVASSDQYLQDKRRRQEEDQTMLKTIIIAVCSAVAYLGLVIGLTIYCSLRLIRSRRQNKAKNETEMTDKSEDINEQQRGLIDEHGVRGASPSTPGFTRNDLQTLGMLGKGMYGDVFLARARGILSPNTDTQVLVKSLLNPNNAQHQMEFKRQAEMFRKAEHDNVVKLLHVCSETEPQLLVLEYCEWGDLKQFLRAMHRDNGRTVKVPPLTPWQKVLMCKQMASGMDKLSSLGYVHKDLATRNILLCPSLDVKISLLGLSRDVYAGEYHTLNGKLLPIRWMAPESVKQTDRFTPKTDMWSFGVLAWEVFTLAEIPYKHEADEDVIEDVQAGHLKPDFPQNCPQNIRNTLDACFQVQADLRPSFAAMTKSLGDFIENEVDV